MSSRIEDRLTSALEARAERITPEDLRPLEVPASRRTRRPAVVLAAAAASTAVLVLPFLLDSATGPDTQGPAGSASPAPSEKASPSSAPSAGSSAGSSAGPSAGLSRGPSPSGSPTAVGPFSVVDTQHADLDGDGRADRVRLMTRPTVGDIAGAKLEIHLADRPHGSHSFLPTGLTPDRLLPAVDLNGDGREQVLATRESGDATELLVIGWDAHSGFPGLVHPSSKAPLVAAWDDQFRRTGFYVDDEGLHSWRTVEPMEVNGSTRVDVEEWSWVVRYDLPVEVATGPGKDAETVTRHIGTGLVPTPEGVRCADIATESAEPC